MADLAARHGLPVWMTEYAQPEGPIAWAATIQGLIADVVVGDQPLDRRRPGDGPLRLRVLGHPDRQAVARGQVGHAPARSEERRAGKEWRTSACTSPQYEQGDW